MRRWLRRRDDWTDKPWREVDFAVIDVETTGLDVKRDSVVSYGAVRVEAGRVLASHGLYGLVCPESPISPQSIAIHTLRHSDVVLAPPSSAAVAELADVLTRRVLVAHAAWIECGFLGRIFRDNGVDFDPPVIDTAALARAAGYTPRTTRTEPGLEWVCTELGLPVTDPHNALGDAVTTAQLFVVLASRLERAEYTTARSFVDLTAGDRRFDVFRQ